MREIERQTKEKLKNGTIQASKSPWASSIVMAKKREPKDGVQEWRMCVDYAEVVNKVTVKDRYPMPNLNGTIDNFNGVVFISVFDVSQGFHQIPMAKASIEVTAFITHVGLFEFTRMPFGVSNGPSTFQRLMDTALEGLNGRICECTSTT